MYDTYAYNSSAVCCSRRSLVFPRRRRPSLPICLNSPPPLPPTVDPPKRCVFGRIFCIRPRFYLLFAFEHPVVVVVVLAVVAVVRPDRAANVRDRVCSGRWPAGGAADPSSGDIDAHGRGAQHGPLQGSFRLPEGLFFSAVAAFVGFFLLAWCSDQFVLALSA